jgi:2-C-methyl-D-erythritol 4-phosphate cytidylyltransferase
MRYALVMPAAGRGTRFAGELPKQYARLAGRSVIEWSLQPFLADPRCVVAVVAVASHDERWPVLTPNLHSRSAGARLVTVLGGEQRCHSVHNAIAQLSQHGLGDDDWVLVHDAARPCVSGEEIDQLLALLASHPLGGLLALRVTDTIKRDDGHGGVAETVPRGPLWRALTPQMFRLGVLRDALDAAFAAATLPTDEAQAVELWTQAGRGRPQLLEGSPDNLKITSRRDLALAEAILQRRLARGAA